MSGCTYDYLQRSDRVAYSAGDAVRAAVHALLPSAVVWPVLDYASYLARLNACDLTLSPFPFGGLHSVIDSLPKQAGWTRKCCVKPAFPTSRTTPTTPHA